MKDNGGMSRLASAINERMSDVAQTFDTKSCDIGTIQSDMSLVCNMFPNPIPRSDYLVCRQLTLGPEGDKLTETEPEPHLHNVKIPKKMKWLEPGDRVLVCWVRNDAVVVDIIT